MTDSTEQNLPPADFVCFDSKGDQVYVMIGGTVTCPHGHSEEFITVGVRDTDSSNEVIDRSEYRELIDLDPVAAIHLARTLLVYATDMLDAPDEEGDE